MHIATLMQRGFHRLMRRLGRLAAAHREMRMLLRADERMLKDIGLTRGDVQSVIGYGAMAEATAACRNAAMAAAPAQIHCRERERAPRVAVNDNGQSRRVVAARPVTRAIDVRL